MAHPDDTDTSQTDRGSEPRRLPRVLHPDPDVAVAEILADIRDEARRRDPDRPGHGRWTVGAILGVAVSVIAIVGSAATTLQGYTQLGDRLQSFGERMLALDARVVLLETTMRDRGHARDQEISSLVAGNSLQDERLQNLTRALEQERQARMEAEADARRATTELRGEVSDLAKSMSEIRTDLKVLVDRAQRHGELDAPEHEAKAGPPTR